MANYKYFGTKDFYKHGLKIALPVMFQLLIQNLVSLIDNFMVSGLGDIKMAGVNTVGQFNFVFIILINAICSAAGIFLTQYKGADDKVNMQQAFRFKILLAGFFGIAYAIVSFWAPEGLYAILLKGNADESFIIEQSQSYARSVSISWIFMIFSQAIASSLRDIEIVTPPLLISISATFINTFFNWVFIYGNLGSPRLEVAGAGYATVIARLTEFVIFCIYAFRKKPEFFFPIKELFSINFGLFKRIIAKSSLIIYADLLWAISETKSTELYNGLGGAEVVSGMAGGFAVSNLFFICFSGIATASTVILGQELGKGHLAEAKKYKNWILSGATVLGALFMVLGFFTVFIVPYIFGNLSFDARKIINGVIIVSALYIPAWAFINAQYAISRTGGDTMMGAICDTAGNFLYILIIILMIKFTECSPVIIYLISKFSDFPKMTIAALWLKKEKWLVNLTVKNQ